MAEDSNHFLYLNPECIEFTPVSEQIQVFYDDGNRQVFVVKDHGAGGFDVKGPDFNTSISFMLDNASEIESVKFSPTCAILAVQRSPFNVEFINFSGGTPVASYLQSSKGKSNKILAFHWTNSTEILFITPSGVELYQVFADKKVVKLVKSFNISVNWAIYQPRTAVLVLSTGCGGNIIQALQIRPGSLYKFPKFEIPIESRKPQNRAPLGERDVALVNLYGKLCLLVLKHDNLPDDYSGAQIVIYTFQKEGPAQKTHVLELELRGRFAISILDNLVVVHHQTSQTSLLFDICLPSFKTEGSVNVHSPLIPPYAIKPYILRDGTSGELYSSKWEIFHPNVIVDGSIGCLWTLELNLDPICRMLSSPASLIDFLLLRRNSKPYLLKVCREAVTGELCTLKSNALGTITFIFNKLNRAYREHLDPKSEITRKVTLDERQRSMVDQTDMYSSVFNLFDEEPKNYSDSFAVAVIFEYIYSLVQHQLPVQYLIYERLINILVKTERFFQLHQFLQYHVLNDSKPLACLLLSLQSKYPHAAQLALDMFKRLSVAQEDIVDIYLSQFDVLRAVRYVQAHGNIDSVSARKFLDFAKNSEDEQLFYVLFKFFEDRNTRLRGSPEFAKGEQCEVFVEHFEKLFGTKTRVLNAVAS